MSQILQAPSAWLALVASPEYSEHLRLTYWVAASQWYPATTTVIAHGAAAAACIDSVNRVLITPPPVPAPPPSTGWVDPNGVTHVTDNSPALNSRSWTLAIPASQANQSLGLMHAIVLGEYCETSATEPGWLLALGFTPYTPVSSVPIPQIC